MLSCVPHMDAASERITDKLWQGTLPADDPVKLWGGNASGLAGDGSDEVVPRNTRSRWLTPTEFREASHGPLKPRGT